MSRKGLVVVALCFAVLAFAVGAVPLSAQADKGDLMSVGAPSSSHKALTVTLGKADMVDVGGQVSDVMVADPTLIDVQAVQSDKLYVVGLRVGDTNIIALDEKGNVVKRIDIHVTYDLMAMRQLIKDLFPKETVQVGAIHDQVMLTGTASSAEVSSRIAGIVGRYVSDVQGKDKPVDEMVSNLLVVKGGQQVMLQVRILEAKRSIIKELGVKTNANDPDELSATTLFGELPGSNQSGLESLGAAVGEGIALSQEAVGTGSAILDSGIAGVGQIGLFLDALEEKNLVNILAEPNLTAVSGETAGFLAGGEFPVPVGRDQVGNLVIEFREFGVSLNFKPVVLSEKRISLQMKTEVSSLDFDNAITLSDTQVPGLDVRKADTTVEVASGGSLMIAGLLKSEAIKGMSGLPGVNKAPVIGKLMSSDSFKRNETELIVIVTPYLVEPYADKEQAEPAVTKAENTASEAPVSARAISGPFVANVRRVYKVEDASLFAGNGQFGYLLD